MMLFAIEIPTNWIYSSKEPKYSLGGCLLNTNPSLKIRNNILIHVQSIGLSGSVSFQRFYHKVQLTLPEYNSVDCFTFPNSNIETREKKPTTNT